MNSQNKVSGADLFSAVTLFQAETGNTLPPAYIQAALENSIQELFENDRFTDGLELLRPGTEERGLNLTALAERDRAPFQDKIIFKCLLQLLRGELASDEQLIKAALGIAGQLCQVPGGIVRFAWRCLGQAAVGACLVLPGGRASPPRGACTPLGGRAPRPRDLPMPRARAWMYRQREETRGKRRGGRMLHRVFAVSSIDSALRQSTRALSLGRSLREPRSHWNVSGEIVAPEPSDEGFLVRLLRMHVSGVANEVLSQRGCGGWIAAGRRAAVSAENPCLGRARRLMGARGKKQGNGGACESGARRREGGRRAQGKGREHGLERSR